MLVISCKKPQKVYTKFSLIGSMRHILLVVVFLLGAIVPGSLVEVSTSEEVVVTVDSTNLRFSPSSVTITEGDSVRFFWSGELLAHNAVAEDGLFDSGDTSRNVDYIFTFEMGMTGTYEYVCEPHEDMGMVGSITVEPVNSTEEEEPSVIEEEETEERALPHPLLSGLASLALASMAPNRRRSRIGE